VLGEPPVFEEQTGAGVQVDVFLEGRGELEHDFIRSRAGDQRDPKRHKKEYPGA